MHRLTLLIPVLFLIPLRADVFSCPKGCGTDTDSSLEEAGHIFVSALKTMRFLDTDLTGSSPTGGIEGHDWKLEWRVDIDEIELNVEESDDGEEENDDFETITVFEFTSQKSTPHLEPEEENIFLEDFSSTHKILSQMREDTEFVYQQQKRVSEESSPRLKKDAVDKRALLEVARIAAYENERDQRLGTVEQTQGRIDALYEKMLSWCIKHHEWKGSIYSRGLIFFERGDFSEAFDDIASFIAKVKKKEREKFLQAEVYFNQGKSASEIGMYREAITALSHAIEKNPKYHDAYFERAIAYFETGNFDLAFGDYLSSNFKSESFTEKTEDILAFASTITLGVQEGSATATVEFVPSLLASVYGISEALWAFAQDPIHVSKDFANAALSCINYVYESSTLETLEVVVPELKELIVNWDALDPSSRGRQTGKIIGKYGIEIFGSLGITKAVKAYQALKRANNLLIFEALAMSERNRATIAVEATKRAAARQQVLKSANLKIQIDKQGKHIVGHKNYKADKSQLTHADPQKLVNKYAGSGQRINNEIPGSP
ncbi:MAG: polymorphic toxin type 50 domain-containing protein, partial [Chlamydiales bacterium]